MALVIMEFQKLGHHLGVGIRGKFHAMALELFLDLQVVLDDAVVDQRDLSVFADVGMGVDIVGLSVGSPAGMADAQCALQVSAIVSQVAEHLKPALGLFHL